MTIPTFGSKCLTTVCNPGTKFLQTCFKLKGSQRSFAAKETSAVSETPEEAKKPSPKKAELTKEEKLKLRRPETDISNEELFSFLKFVKLNQLNQDERLIHEKHVEALKIRARKYTDPNTGLLVSTRMHHFLRGRCCGSICRHCPYDHQAVEDELKTKTFNSAFFS